DALKAGRVSSSLVTFDFADVKVINTQFKAVVRELKYDFAELAIATYLQGHEYRKPYVLLPATIMGRGQHHTIFYNAGRGLLRPAGLNGKRVGVRAYTVTTGMWVRGILAGDYDVDLESITWVTFEEPHVAEYRDPPHVERAPAGEELKQRLLDGELDAAILGGAQESHTVRAPACGERAEADAARRRARCSDSWRRLRAGTTQASVSRSRRGGTALGPRPRRRAHQPYGGDAQRDRRIATWGRARG